MPITLKGGGGGSTMVPQPDFAIDLGRGYPNFDPIEDGVILPGAIGDGDFYQIDTNRDRSDQNWIKHYDNSRNLLWEFNLDTWSLSDYGPLQGLMGVRKDEGENIEVAVLCHGGSNDQIIMVELDPLTGAEVMAGSREYTGIVLGEDWVMLSQNYNARFPNVSLYKTPSLVTSSSNQTFAGVRQLIHQSSTVLQRIAIGSDNSISQILQDNPSIPANRPLLSYITDTGTWVRAVLPYQSLGGEMVDHYGLFIGPQATFVPIPPSFFRLAVPGKQYTKSYGLIEWDNMLFNREGLPSAIDKVKFDAWIDEVADIYGIRGEELKFDVPT
jgi:hypothetical protein